jgi:hypothetical protein
MKAVVPIDYGANFAARGRLGQNVPTDRGFSGRSAAIDFGDFASC